MQHTVKIEPKFINITKTYLMLKYQFHSISSEGPGYDISVSQGYYQF